MSIWRDPSYASGAPFVLRDVTVPAIFTESSSRSETRRLDIGIEDGVIRFVTPHDARMPTQWRSAQMAGAMAWPCFAEPHAHLDSTQIWQRSPNPDGSFAAAASAIVSDRETYWSLEDMRERMEFGLRCAFAHGVRAMRTHLASQNDQIEQRWEVYSALRAEWAGAISLQAVPLIATDALADEAMLQRVVNVVRRHEGVLGAFAPMSSGIDDHLTRLFNIAEANDLSLDFHADENADPASNVLYRIASIAQARRFKGRITVSHCCSLAMQSEEQIDRTLDLVAEAGITIVSLPGCNLYLQDRKPGRTPRWRGVTLLHEMHARGIKLAIGADNCRDPFHAYGDFDPLSSFRDAVRVAHLDLPISDWAHTITTTPGDMVDAAHMVAPGNKADLILFRARTFNELLSRPQSDRLLIRGGAVTQADLPEYSELDALMDRRPS